LAFKKDAQPDLITLERTLEIMGNIIYEGWVISQILKYHCDQIDLCPCLDPDDPTCLMVSKSLREMFCPIYRTLSLSNIENDSRCIHSMNENNPPNLKPPPRIT
jgi:hypothetical protein